MPFAMIDRGIISSSINDESVSTRWFWVVLLALKDESGVISGTISALARKANIPLNQAKEAMSVLTAPDENSTTRAEGGRRIVNTGPNRWFVVNHEQYTDNLRYQKQKELSKRTSQKYRDKRKAELNRDVSVTPSDAIEMRDGDERCDMQDGLEPNGSLSSARPSDDHRLTILADVLDHWNSKPGLASVKANTIIKAKTAAGRKRRAAALARITEHPDLDDWRTVIDRIAARPHCNGDNDRGWIADVGYLFGVETFDNHWTGKFSKPVSRNPSNTHSTGPDIGEWMYGTYRRSDHDAHHEDDRWTEYTEWASNNFDYETAPTFSEWRKG